MSQILKTILWSAIFHLKMKFKHISLISAFVQNSYLFNLGYAEYRSGEAFLLFGDNTDDSY